jgi:YVTN family beta-propeller protein
VRIRSSVLLAASLLAAVAAAGGAHARPMLIVTAEAGGDLVFIDVAKAAIVERVKVGARPRGLKLARDKRRLLVAVAGPPKTAAPAKPPAGEPGLAIVDVASRKVVKHIATPPAPFAVDLLSDGKTAYLSNSDTNEIVAVDLAAGAVTKKLSIGMEPQGVSVRPDGKVVYVATRGAHEVSAIDSKKMTLLGRIDAGLRPQSVVFAPRGDTAFVMDEGLPTVTILDATRNVSREMFPIQGLSKTHQPVLQSAVFAPDGKHLYVTTGPGWSVVILDPAKKALVGVIDSVGAFTRGIAISPDGKKLYTANTGSNDVAIIDVASRKVESRVPVPGGPWAIVVLP